MFKKIILIVFILMLLSPAIKAQATIDSQYSYTTQKVIERLREVDATSGQKNNFPETIYSDSENGQDEPVVDETTPPEPVPEPEPVKEEASQKDSIRIMALPLSENRGTILEQMQTDKNIAPGGIVENADRIGTSIYETTSKTVIGIAPVLLIAGAVFLLFSRGRAIGLIVIVTFAIFLILNAPTIVQMILSYLFGIFQ